MGSTEEPPSPEQIGERVAEIVRDIMKTDPPWGSKQRLAAIFGMSAGHLSKYLRESPPRTSEQTMVSISQRIGLDLAFFFMSEEELAAVASSRPEAADLPRWHHFLFRTESRNLEPLRRLQETVLMAEAILHRREAGARERAERAWEIVKALRKFPVMAHTRVLDGSSVIHASLQKDPAHGHLLRRFEDPLSLQVYVDQARRFAEDLEKGIERTMPETVSDFDELARVVRREPRE